ncbi:MAG: hypothetical protein ABIN23_04470 [candidate division WOR-3 bacterium]
MKGLFSQRYGHQKKKILSPQEMPDELRNRLWNIINLIINSCLNLGKEWVIKEIWDAFFKKDLDEIKFPSLAFSWKIKPLFFLLKWYEVYDFIEFLIQKIKDIHYPTSSGKISLRKVFINEINKIFEEEGVPYKIIDDYVTPFISEVEIKEIEKALKIDNKYEPVKKHLSKAIELYSRRPNPDYQNSIKESISAVESLVMIITNGKSNKLSDLVEELNIHKALKEAIKKLYGWASDEGGIRHGEKPISSQIKQEDACFALVICSSIINYIISKYNPYSNKNTKPPIPIDEFKTSLKNLNRNKIII